MMFKRFCLHHLYRLYTKISMDKRYIQMYLNELIKQTFTLNLRLKIPFKLYAPFSHQMSMTITRYRFNPIQGIRYMGPIRPHFTFVIFSKWSLESRARLRVNLINRLAVERLVCHKIEWFCCFETFIPIKLFEGFTRSETNFTTFYSSKTSRIKLLLMKQNWKHSQ